MLLKLENIMDYIVQMLDYMVQAFGFINLHDVQVSSWHVDRPQLLYLTAKWSAALGVLFSFVEQVTGLATGAFLAFVVLVVMEVWTGIRSSMKKGDKIQSRKFGRMLFKVGYYVGIIGVLHLLHHDTEFVELGNIELDPFLWLYHTFIIAVVFQLIISVLENLGKLGYKESQTIAGLVLRRFNKYFELDEKQPE